MSKYNKEKLEELLLVKNLSYEATGRLYGVTGNAIKKAAKRLNIILPAKRTINPSETEYKNSIRIDKRCKYCGKPIDYTHKEFCSYRCLKLSRRDAYIKRWLEGKEAGFYNVDGKDINNYLRDYLLEEANYKCQKCGWGKVNPFTGKIPLQIHHIDGNCTNNSKDNLIVLCPNCHSLTENYGSRNKGSKRVR
jgi:endogenous inhibitor of DNA gyrase (YacG/DUF329 family)